jgi:hypothetical protein
MILGHRVQLSVEFEYDRDGICVPGEVDKVLELIYVSLYIPFALVVLVGL